MTTSSGPRLAAAFFVLASAAILLTRLNGGVALLWVANAPLLAQLCRPGPGRWRHALLWAAPASLAASALFGPVLWASPFLALASIVEALVAAALLRRFVADCDYFRTARSVLLFAAIAGLAAPMASGLIAASVAALALHRSWAGTYLDWVLGHGLGMLIASPVTLLLDGRSWRAALRRPVPQLWGQGGLLLGVVACTTAAVFCQEKLPLLFLPALPILLATFRLGRPGAALSIVLVAMIGGTATALGHGPVVMTGLSHVGQLQFFQFYLVATFAMSLPVAVALGQAGAALARLRESNRLFGMAGAIASIGYWRWETVSGAIQWSDEMFSIFGLVNGAVPPLDGIMASFHPDDRERVERLLELAVNEGAELDYAARLIRADGGVRHVVARGQVERDDAGAVIALFGVFQDVTERALAEETLRNSEARLRVITEQASDMIALIGVDGTCLFMSPASEAILGLSPAAMIGRRPLNLTHPDDRVAIERYGADLRRGRQAPGTSLRFRMRRADGAYAWIESSARLTRLAERDCIVAVCRDVTHQVAIDAELRAARTQAEAASVAKAGFLANMSHEIRTPMNGVIGFAELLLTSDLTDEQRRDASLIVDSGRTMMKLLNDILDLSKIEAGQLDVTEEPFDLPHALRACGKLLSPGLAQKRLGFDIVLAPDLPRMVVGDALRLRQIVLNLLGNAIKFTDGGSVSLAARVVDDNGADWLAITIADTGIGIAPDRQASIFEEFVQADHSITRRYGGTGLGLAISNRLARLMGGRITLESQPDRGTSVTLALPARLAEPAADAMPMAAPAPPRPVRAAHILVAEDNEVNQLLVRSMLERGSHRVTMVGDGAAAVEAVGAAAAAGAPFDLVLMDMQMPVLDGLAATCAIRSSAADGGCRVPIVALTANAFVADLEACRDAGMDDHVAKPVAMAALFAAVDRHLAAPARPAGAPGGRAAFRPGATATAKYEAQRDAVLSHVDALVRRGAFTDAELEEVAQWLHKLAGTAGMFGEAALGDVAGELEDELRDWPVDERPSRARAAAGRLRAAA